MKTQEEACFCFAGFRQVRPCHLDRKHDETKKRRRRDDTDDHETNEDTKSGCTGHGPPVVSVRPPVQRGLDWPMAFDRSIVVAGVPSALAPWLRAKPSGPQTPRNGFKLPCTLRCPC